MVTLIHMLQVVSKLNDSSNDFVAKVKIDFLTTQVWYFFGFSCLLIYKNQR